MLKKGTLTLIPTPIEELGHLDSETFNVLARASDCPNSIIVVEEHKACRRRWIHWGLNREKIDQFFTYNEHNREDQRDILLAKLQKGNNVYLMSDGGLPAFCDPGQKLVDACHRAQIKVSSTAFSHSIALAIALSGLPHQPYTFLGFPPAKKEDRQIWLKRELKRKETLVLMDTPYRLKALSQDLADICPQRVSFWGLDLNRAEEIIKRGKCSQMSDFLKDKKAEFICVLDRLS
jgi:16S rRNA (cytidine1402-2'-O)-methyltransferase